MTTHIHVHTTDDSERWITMTGSHVLVNGVGKVIAGAGGRLSSKSKITTPLTQASKPSEQKTTTKK
jgi:hypothetical protein